MLRSYTELSKILTFEDRFEYLKLSGTVGASTFGRFRFINQSFYMSPKWKQARNEVIIRDHGCDLGVPGYEIFDKVIIHHMNPITMEQLEKEDPVIYDPEYLICVTERTHNAIHYGDRSNLLTLPPERRPGDTCPWK